MKLGVANSNLKATLGGSPYLEYEGGGVCNPEGPKKNWHTRIEFICDNKTSNANTEPVASIIENNDCRLLIHYRTPLACQEQITCKANAYVDHTGVGTELEVVDLTPLISTNDNYEAHFDRNAFTEEQVGKSTKVMHAQYRTCWQT